jgi:hypothetical protein
VADAPLIWQENEETGGRALLPDIAAWRVRGWKPCDGPPAEEDRLHDPAEDPAAEPVNLDSQPVDGENLPEALHADEVREQDVDPDAVTDPRPQPTPVGETPVPATKSMKAADKAKIEEADRG